MDEAKARAAFARCSATIRMIRQLPRGKLDPERARELLDEMRAAGLPT